MRKKWLPIGIIAMSFAISSCQKQLSLPKEESSIAINPDKVSHLPETAEEKMLVSNLSKVSSIFQELYKEKKNRMVVNAAIISRLCTDESVFLRELIYPENGRLLRHEPFLRIAKGLEVSLQSFAKSFWSKAASINDEDFKAFLESMDKNQNIASRQGIDGLEATIYAPYTDKFDELTPAPGYEVPIDEYYYAPFTTIVTATADADEAWGEQPVYDGLGTFMYYRTVLINDDYAYENPTHIIGVNGIEYEPTDIQPNEAFPPTDPIDIPTPREIKQVYVGDVRCRNQYDKLVSFTGNGGGSEIRFMRTDAYLKLADGHVQPDGYIVGDQKSISRKDIRRENWVNYAAEWDGDWEIDNHQQNLAIWEEDNRNSSTINGSLSTTVKVTVPDVGEVSRTSTIGFTITYKSDDYIIKQINYNRDVFFVLNRTNLEGEMYKGWPVRDRNTAVSFTLNDRTYY